MNTKTKMRLPSILLCFVMVLGLLPMAVLAADITSVTISGIDHPVDGQALDFTYTLPNGASYIKNTAFDEVIWYDQGTEGFSGASSYNSTPSGTKLSSGAKAVAGHYYVAELHLARSGDNVFPKGDSSVTLNLSDDMKLRAQGKDLYLSTPSQASSYYAVVRLYYRADIIYDEWNYVWLELDKDFNGTLVAGDTPWTAADFTNVSINHVANDFDLSVAWSDGSKTLTDGDKFEAGKTYKMTLTLDSAIINRYATFKDPVTVIINNGDIAVGDANVNSNYQAAISFSFSCMGGVSSLDIEGIQNPVPGEAPQTSGFTVGPYSTTIKSVKWYTDTEVPIEVTGNIEPNTAYQLELTMDAPSGYVYDLTKENIAANLGTVKSFYVGDDGAVTVTIIIDGICMPGDATGDGNVNLADVSLTLKYIAKWDVTIDTYVADVTGDSIVNLADVSLLLKYIAKWDVVLK